MLDVYVIHDDGAQRKLIRDVLAPIEEAPGQLLFNIEPEYPTGREGLAGIKGRWNGRVSLAIVRLQLPDTSGLELIGKLKQSCPQIHVIPVLEGDEAPETWKALLELELLHVLKGGSSPEEMKKVLSQVHQHLLPALAAEPGPSNSYVISVVAARGGTGKSIVATNLACSLAKKINKKTENVVFLDMSLNAGDIRLFLDIAVGSTIMDAVAQGANLDIDYFSRILVQHPTLGFHLLPCPAQEFDSTPFDYNIAAQILAVARETAKFVIIDTGQFESGPTVAALDYSDVVYVVTPRDLAHLLATAHFLHFIKQGRGIPISRIKVIVNEADESTDVLESEIEAMLDHAVTAYIPSDAVHVVESINHGMPVVVELPDQPFSTVLDQLAAFTYHRWMKHN